MYPAPDAGQDMMTILRTLHRRISELDEVGDQPDHAPDLGTHKAIPSRPLSEDESLLVFVFDPLQLVTTAMSPSSRHVIGYDATDVEAFWGGEALFPDTLHELIRFLTDVLEQIHLKRDKWTEPWITEMNWRHKDGSTVVTETVITPVVGPDGEPSSLVWIARDVTKRRQIENQLSTLSQRLLRVHETERRSIARELHDEIGQGLSALKMLLERSAAQGVNVDESYMNEAQQLISELITQTRDLSLDIRPGVLDELGLLPAVLRHIDRFNRRTGITVQCTQNGLNDRRFDPDVETAGYRSIQEGLTNVLRHAGVREAEVKLRASHGILTIRIQDRGKGFDTEGTFSPDTCGLEGIHERAASCGGQFTIESGPGQGTTLTIQLPFDDTIQTK